MEAPHIAVPDTGRALRVRMRVLELVIVGFFILVGLRLGQIQIVEANNYREMAQKQYRATIVLPAERGILYDRNGNVISSNTRYLSFAADPKLASEDARVIAAKFSRAFGKPRSYYMDKLTEDSRFVWLERQVPSEYRKRIDDKRLDGVVVRTEPKRLYHNDHVAGQLTGFTDIDNKGLAGLELQYDHELRGTDGYVVFQRDGLGHARPSVDYPKVDPVNGHNIYLTIDMELQSLAERELRKGVEDNDAERGIMVLMQPKTGEVLAMGQYPPLDPNKFNKSQPEDQRLRAVTDVFEPGSVFKIVTVSAAIENNLIKPQDRFFAENGKYIVAGRPKPIVDVHEYGSITFQEAMEYSSNIVMAKASDIIGAERFYRMARNYGFGIATNIEYPGEVKGVLKKPSEWSGTTLNSMAFGYEVGVTPLQIATAYCAVANGGYLMAPQLFRKEVDATGQVLSESQPQVIRRVVSEHTAKTLKDFLVGVVERGTGKPAMIPGAVIAGKTGTSRKLIEGRYETQYTASFVGFFPADDPQVVCLVMLDNPRGSNYTGGTVSAPVFRAIAQHLINTSELFAPPLPQGVSTAVAEQPRPQEKAGTAKNAPAAVTFSANLIPDVRGLSVRRAVATLKTRKLEPVVAGSGTVVRQNPVAGQPAKEGTRVTLVCQPKAVQAMSLK
jgi:cell division protein FtsI (penicillin-binding protein 3)